jgi:uncharacterized peroxidase-related enzyme
MSRIAIPALEESSAAVRPTLDAIGAKLGVVPNLHRLLGNSPAALESYVGFNAALAKTLDVKTRERIAIAVAQANGCDYCLSAHAYLGLNLAKIDEAEIALNRKGHSADARADAAVAFAVAVAETRGQVSDPEVAAVRLAGFNDAQIVEIVATVALNSLTNFLNNVADTEIDFPIVRTTEAV